MRGPGCRGDHPDEGPVNNGTVGGKITYDKLSVAELPWRNEGKTVGVGKGNQYTPRVADAEKFPTRVKKALESKNIKV